MLDDFDAPGRINFIKVRPPALSALLLILLPLAEILRQEVRVGMEIGVGETRGDARQDELALAGNRCARDGSLWFQ